MLVHGVPEALFTFAHIEVPPDVAYVRAKSIPIGEPIVVEPEIFAAFGIPVHPVPETLVIFDHDVPEAFVILLHDVPVAFVIFVQAILEIPTCHPQFLRLNRLF